MKNRYEIQKQEGGLWIEQFENWRIIDTNTDSRIATCYNEDNAVIVMTALNFEWDSKSINETTEDDILLSKGNLKNKKVSSHASQALEEIKSIDKLNTLAIERLDNGYITYSDAPMLHTIGERMGQAPNILKRSVFESTEHLIKFIIKHMSL